MRRLLLFALVLPVVFGCASSAAQARQTGTTLNLVAYSTPKPVMEKLITRFQHQPATAELREDALEKLRRDALSRGELLGRRQPGRRGGQFRHRPERVVDLGRDPHGAPFFPSQLRGCERS